MWKKGKNLMYLYVKLSILSIGGARLIFMNSSKCPTKSLIKKGDVVLSGSFAWRYSLSQLSISNQVALITDKPVHTTQNPEFFSEYELDTLKF